MGQAGVRGQPLFKLAGRVEVQEALVVGSVEQRGEGFVLREMESVWRWADAAAEPIGQVRRERS